MSGSIKQKIEPVARGLARVGCFSIGTVYVLIGVWAMLALLRLADPAADEERIMQRMLEWPLGSLLIGALAAGAVGYMLWLLFEAVFDPYQFGSGWKGIAERIGIGLSTLAYGVIVSSAVKVLVGRGGHREEKQQLLVGHVLSWPAGQWLVGAMGLMVAVAGLHQVKYVYEKDHQRRLKMDGRGRFTRLLITVLAWAGYSPPCAILLVLGWFLLRATWSSDPRAVGDTDSAFNFLGLNGGHLGDAVFSTVALGTIAYGLFLYINGVYFRFHAD